MEMPSAINATVQQIYAARVARSDNGLRPHLGASVIGSPCSRALWFAFRWVRKASFDGRMLRLFNTGQLAEARFVEELRWIGCEVSEGPAAGQQWRFAQFGGHFGGSMDAAIKGLPEAPATWHVCEMKTHNAKSFKLLSDKGVKASKPAHWCQMQIYMALSGMTRALYLAVNKDTDALYSERIEADPVAAKQLLDRAESIIFAAEPPPGISTDPSWYECKFCDYADHCHSNAAPLPTCRSCAHATPERDGTWTCEKNGLRAMAEQAQKDGCQSHRFIPKLLENFAEMVSGNDAGNTVQYKNKLTGNYFSNARGSATDYSSDEIYACIDKRALGDATVTEIKTEFPEAEVVF